MKAEEYLKENDLPNPVIIKRGITKQTLNIVLYMSELMEDYAKKEAIDFLKFDDLGDKNCRHLTDKDYEELYQQYLDQKKDES